MCGLFLTKARLHGKINPENNPAEARTFLPASAGKPRRGTVAADAGQTTDLRGSG